ncbi:uncharacterized protein MELLADRAFT_70311 [Melampsora larici-populina 98AG31]|uniref:Uncharacterized protein n=1 Tax=Melampsora larici-populina (strain 98AG31 / pathotype 3-4-7) TaxID=747676 RepID=F4SEF7_MELLP|nr:uncharacterized protein MELLADRAFT_70311 [Melampsora larici-populina 98AG31]EGF96970.1 hypothetical protein MELLADRAFT_70311 [Melampsora larici-populina 98AG31]
MAHRKSQNTPVPVSPGDRIRSFGSPSKRHAMPFPVRPTSPPKPNVRQPALCAPLSPNSTLPWSHSVTDAAVAKALAHGHGHGRMVYGYGGPPQYHSPLVNINSMMMQPNVFGQGSFSAPDLPSASQVLTPTPTPNVIHLDHEELDEALTLSKKA